MKKIIIGIKKLFCNPKNCIFTMLKKVTMKKILYLKETSVVIQDGFIVTPLALSDDRSFFYRYGS